MTALFPDPGALPPRFGRLANGLTLGGLGLLVFGTVGGISASDSSGQRLAALLLLAAASVAWVGWVLVRNSAPDAVVGACLVVVAAAGGALAAFSPIALVFPGIATLAAASRWPLAPSALVGGAGVLGALLATEFNGNSVAVVWGGLSAVFVGLITGLTRRQAVAQAEQMTRLELASERIAVERTRAEVLAERNHLARELHDVLAHTLSALSLQLQAFETVVETDPETSQQVREQLARTQELVRTGLDEARGAVRALRDDAVPLDERLAKLAQQHGAAFSLSGPCRPLAPETALALYRVTQEALTNAMKHATGAVTSVELAFDGDAVRLTVDNELPSANGADTGGLHRSGGGFGLRGIAERVALLGGEVEAGPFPGGWRVRAVVPAPGTTPAPPTPADDPIAS